MGRSILTSFVSRQAGTAFGGRLELAPSVKELEEARRGGGGGGVSLPPLVRGGIFEPNSFVHQRPR